MTLEEVLTRFLCCPYDHSDLGTTWELVQQRGTIHCSQCHRAWPIAEGIPSLMPDYFRQGMEGKDEESEEAMCLSEINMRDAQAEIYDNLLSGGRRETIEIPTTLQEFHVRPDDVVVELGIGTGRALKYAEHCKLAIGCDFSLASLRKLQTKRINNLILIQADATLLPLRGQIIDSILTVELFHHIPSQRARRQHLQECKRILRNGGQYVMSGVYNFSLLQRLRDIKTVYTKDDLHPGAEGKTGYHTNNSIYYYNFDIRELRKEAEEHFQVIDAFGFWVDIWIEYFGILGRLLDRMVGTYRLDKIWHHTWIGDRFGRVLLLRMIKPG